MSEADIQAAIRIALGRRPDLRVWRNQCGEAWQGRVISSSIHEVVLEHPRRVTFGVASPGGSDLLGLRQITVTPAMVGQIIAQFAAVEVKPLKGGRFQDGQREFIAFVNAFGGVAGVARSPIDALGLFATPRAMAGAAS